MRGREVLSRVLPVLGVLFVTLGVPPAANTPDRAPAEADIRPGVLLVAHGANREWNRQIKDVAEALRDHYPTEILFLMGEEKEPSAAVYHRLERQGISSIVIVPLFVSSHSDHFEQVRFVAGLRDTCPHAEHVKLDPIRTERPIVLVGAMDDSLQMAEILLDRARAMSRTPAAEVVLLVAHGPNSDEDAALWTRNLEAVARRVEKEGGFREVATRLIRDDAPTEVRSAAVEQVRQFVQERSVKSSVIVVPVLMAQGEISKRKVPEILRDLECRYTGETLLPHLAVARWAKDAIREGLRGSVANVRRDGSTVGVSSPEGGGGS